MAICNRAPQNQNSGGTAPAPALEIQAQQSQTDSYDFGDSLNFPLLGDNQKKELTKGVYKIDAFVDVGNDKPVSIDRFTENIEVDGQVKKVRYKRVTISEPQDVDGRQLSRLKATVSIDENPIPIAVIIWGAICATGLTAGGYFVNSVNRFTESSFNQILTIAGLAVSGYFAFVK